MKNFVRMTKLHDLKGRVNYITDSKRQENLISIINGDTDFSDLIKFEKNNSRSKNQGRELIIALPNEWLNLPKNDLDNHIKEMISITVGDNFDYTAAIHLNKKKTNLHCHVVFSERERALESYKTYKKDVYLDSNGNLAKKREDRVKLIAKKGDFKLDKNGNKIPLKITFGNKDLKFKDYGFLNECKDKIFNYYKHHGITIEKREPIPEKHIGKGENEFTERISKENEIVRKINKIVNKDTELKEEIKKKWSENKDLKLNFLVNSISFIKDFLNKKKKNKVISQDKLKINSQWDKIKSSNNPWEKTNSDKNPWER